MIKTYKDLFVWQKAMVLVTNIYKLSQSFPVSELYGLSNQMRRSAVSIPSNIAEGYGRHSRGDYKRFLQIAAGSLYELQTQLEISFNLGFVDYGQFNTCFGCTKEVERMLTSLINKL